jgi:hypothetical protein
MNNGLTSRQRNLPPTDAATLMKAPWSITSPLAEMDRFGTNQPRKLSTLPTPVRLSVVNPVSMAFKLLPNITWSSPPWPLMVTVALLAKRMLSKVGLLTSVNDMPPRKTFAMLISSWPVVPLMVKVAAGTVLVIGAIPAKSIVWVTVPLLCVSVPASRVAPAV